MRKRKGIALEIDLEPCRLRRKKQMPDEQARDVGLGNNYEIKREMLSLQSNAGLGREICILEARSFAGSYYRSSTYKGSE